MCTKPSFVCVQYCNQRWRVGDLMFFQTMDWTGDGGPIFLDLRFADDILLFAGSAELINW